MNNVIKKLKQNEKKNNDEFKNEIEQMKKKILQLTEEKKKLNLNISNNDETSDNNNVTQLKNKLENFIKEKEKLLDQNKTLKNYFSKLDSKIEEKVQIIEKQESQILRLKSVNINNFNEINIIF